MEKKSYPRGPYLVRRNQERPANTDCGAALVARVARMGREPERLERIRAMVLAIHDIAGRCETLADALWEPSDNSSLSMKIRHFHDDIDLKTTRHCMGALYRTAGYDKLCEDGILHKSLVRQEHTIPANIVAGMIFHHFRGAPVEELADFLLTQTIITATTRDEDKIINGLRRSYPEAPGRTRWKDEHPCFDQRSHPHRGGARPFLRYHQTGIQVRFWPTGETVDLASDTLDAHRERVRRFDLYRVETYFPSAVALAA